MERSDPFHNTSFTKRTLPSCRAQHQRKGHKFSTFPYHIFHLTNIITPSCALPSRAFGSVREGSEAFGGIRLTYCCDDSFRISNWFCFYILVRNSNFEIYTYFFPNFVWNILSVLSFMSSIYHFYRISKKIAIK